MVSMPSESGVTSSSSLILDVARENTGLHRRAQRDHFVRIQLGVRPGAEQHFDRASAPAECASIRPPSPLRRSAPRVTPASLMQSRHGPSVRSTIGVISLSNSSRVISR